MATTSLWRVRGYIGKVLLYAENPEKTTLPKSIGFDDADKDTLEDVIAYTVQEVADILGISRNHAYEYIGKIPAIRSVRIGATIRISKKSFDTWLDEQGF